MKRWLRTVDDGAEMTARTVSRQEPNADGTIGEREPLPPHVRRQKHRLFELGVETERKGSVAGR